MRGWDIGGQPWTQKMPTKIDRTMDETTKMNGGTQHMDDP